MFRFLDNQKSGYQTIWIFAVLDFHPKIQQILYQFRKILLVPKLFLIQQQSFNLKVGLLSDVCDRRDILRVWLLPPWPPPLFGFRFEFWFVQRLRHCLWLRWRLRLSFPRRLKNTTEGIIHAHELNFANLLPRVWLGYQSLYGRAYCSPNDYFSLKSATFDLGWGLTKAIPHAAIPCVLGQ